MNGRHDAAPLSKEGRKQMADAEEAKVQDIRTGGTPKVVWDDSAMKSTYANVCNVASTREEVVVLFGTNQAWKGSEQEVTVQLSDRLILSPFAAKRLSLLLNNVVAQYEDRFGKLDGGAIAPPTVTKN
jgi:hypothetical protein